MAAPPERLISDRLEIGDDEGDNGNDDDSISGDGVELIKKSGKSKDQKLAKS